MDDGGQTTPGDAATRLDELFGQAWTNRRDRRSICGGSAGPVGSLLMERRRRAAGLVEELVTGSLPSPVDFESYMTSIATRIQLASASIAIMETRIDHVIMGSSHARAIATAVAEAIGVVEDSYAGTGSLQVRLDIRLWQGRLIVRLDATGNVAPNGAAGSARSLALAARIAAELGGGLRRNFLSNGMVIAMTFPGSIAVGRGRSGGR